VLGEVARACIVLHCLYRRLPALQPPPLHSFSNSDVDFDLYAPAPIPSAVVNNVSRRKWVPVVAPAKGHLRSRTVRGLNAALPTMKNATVFCPSSSPCRFNPRRCANRFNGADECLNNVAATLCAEEVGCHTNGYGMSITPTLTASPEDEVIGSDLA
jgi:hypothetical protein